MHFIFSIIPSVLVLGVLIIIHEFGHFLACRLSGVNVEKFSIGFGPEIFHWQTNRTRYAVSLFPLGGFVKPAGESVSEVGEQGLKPGDYLAAPLFSRIFIVVAGVAMNYILAFILFSGIFMAGRPVPGTVIGGLMDGYPAKSAGIKAGDEILQVNGKDVQTWSDLTGALENSPGEKIELKIQGHTADGQPAGISMLQVAPKVENVKDIFSHPFQVKRLGITPSPKGNKIEKFGFLESVKHAWETEIYLAGMTHKAIFYLLLGRLSLKTVSGPIGIITMTGAAVHLGWVYLLQLTASLSISLAVINLLPIPALDGGHFLFLLIEGIIRKPVSLKVQERATQAGFFLLLIFMSFVIYNDFVNMNILERIRGFFPGH